MSFKNLTSAVIVSLFAVLFVAGCASTKVTKGEILVDRKLPRPETIWVCDFVAATKEMQAKAEDPKAKNIPIKQLTPEQKQLGDQLGRSIAAQLIKAINAMGLKAQAAAAASKPQLNDIVLRGYLYALDAGDTTTRIFIGFGYGASSVNTLLEGYQMTPDGLHKLSSANIEAVSGQMPGGGATSVAAFILFRNPIALIVSPAVQGIRELAGGPTIEGRAESTAAKIAEVLKERFQQVGWIKAENDN